VLISASLFVERKHVHVKVITKIYMLASILNDEVQLSVHILIRTDLLSQFRVQKANPSYSII